MNPVPHLSFDLRASKDFSSLLVNDRTAVRALVKKGETYLIDQGSEAPEGRRKIDDDLV